MRRKILSLIMALTMPFSALYIRADVNGVIVKIPLKVENGKKLSRDLIQLSIESCYYGMLSAVYTSVAYDLGEIDVTVTNCSTGELWEDTFDSSTESQHLIQISSAPGLYEVTYTTESGDLYEGTFFIE